MLSQKNKKWFNKTCLEIRRKLKYACRALSKPLNNSFLRGKYYQLKAKYKSTCRKLKRNFEQNLLQTSESMHSTNSELFCDMLKWLTYNFEQKNIKHFALKMYWKQ